MRLLLSIALLYSLTGYSQPKDKRCYEYNELLGIATKITEGKECDTLYKNQLRLQKKDSILLNNKDKEISNLNSLIGQKDSIIFGKDNEIKTINLQLENTKKTLAVTQVGLGVTLVAILVKALFIK